MTLTVEELVSSNPATGEEVARFPIADFAAVQAAVGRARAATTWWQGLGYQGRKQRLVRWEKLISQRLDELADLIHREGGKPRADILVELAPALDHVHWSAKNAKRVLKSRRVQGSMFLTEFTAHLEYQPYGVVGVIGPWNYPILTPMGSITYALAAGNTVVFKPSEYTPAIAQWYVDRFNDVVPEYPVLQIVHGLGETGGHLTRAGVDKLAFTGSAATGKKVMAACAQTLTPVVIEAGGKDAMIVDSDADVAAAADAAVWGAMTNAGQTCIGIERAYVVAPVYDEFVSRVVETASKLTTGEGGDIGPITMPRQIEIIRRHIADAIDRGGRALVGGVEAVTPPYVSPTVLVDVPEDAPAVREETFGPTLTIAKVADVDEAVTLANATSYGLGGSVFGRARAWDLARRMRSGMVSINGTLAFAGFASLPFGGVGDSGFGRIHGDDGLREFSRPKAITRRRFGSPIPLMSYGRKPRHITLTERAIHLLHG